MWERRGGRGREEDGEGGKMTEREKGDDDNTIQPCRRIHRRTHKYSKTSRASLCRMSSSPPERYLILPL